MSEIDLMKARIVELEEKVQFLYKKLNLSYGGESSEVDPRIIEQLKKGNKIEAIKIYRELFNSSLVDAKNAVEKIAEGISRYP